MEEYHKSRLTGPETIYYEKILSALRASSNQVSAPPGMSCEQLKRCTQALKYDHPELFYVNFYAISYRTSWKSVEYLPEYLYSPEESQRQLAMMERQTEEILTDMERAGRKSIYQKCGWLHDYLVKNCTYDYAALGRPEERREAYSIEGVFRERAAVCQGFAMAYQYLCRRAGIDAVSVRGLSLRPGSQSFEPHGWNIICANGAAAHVDVTWDLCMSSGEDAVRYDYFFLPDLEIMRDHQYVGYPVCPPLQSSYFERAGRQFMGLPELEAYVRREYDRTGQKQRRLDLYFRMGDRKVSGEEIEKSIVRQIRNCTDRGFSYQYSPNKAQSVYYYSVTIK